MVLVLVFSTLLYAEEPLVTVKKELAAHITTDAQTGSVGHVSLTRSPGANLNTDLLLASLSVVIVDRFSIGTVPALYLIDEHRVNVAGKYFFWKGEEFFWALSPHYVLYHVRNNLETAPFSPYFLEIDIYGLQLAVNYMPLGTRWSFGISINQLYTNAKIKYGLTEKVAKNLTEPGVDVSYAWNEKIDTTLGLGLLRSQGLSAFEDVKFGFGVSMRWNRPGRFWSAPQFGVHYTPDTDNFLYLFSTKIY